MSDGLGEPGGGRLFNTGGSSEADFIWAEQKSNFKQPCVRGFEKEDEGMLQRWIGVLLRWSVKYTENGGPIVGAF